MVLSRRQVLQGGGAALVASALPYRSAAAAEVTLTPRPSRASLIGGSHPDTEVWAYNGEVPGPTLRFRQGERARIVVENRLPQPTTVHWHGLRLPNAMDGVPDLTQKPVEPGDRFVYEFDLPDAGTFWYHPHVRSAEQVERGLSGAFIVEEREAIAVDRDVVWLLDDWRLTQEGAIAGDFGNLMDASHAGRLGNTVTINGRVPERFDVRAGERVRLRLINASNARVMALAFEGHAPTVVAIDGHPVEPHAPEGGRVVLGPAMRADLIIDMTASPDRSYAVVDSFYARGAYKLVDLVYEAGASGARPRGAVAALPANPLPQPDLGRAERHRIELGGGMMDPRVMRAMREGSGHEAMTQMRERMRQGRIWTINGISVLGHMHEPLLTLQRGRSYIFEMLNDTAWHHPMHLHGMPFVVLSRNGASLPRRVVQDTVLMNPGERVEIAFVAESAGDWMFHCHILEHQEAGMMGTVRVV
jgi:FtsP/CotA-like multicopper oxidase with cupredoxin domain